MNASPETAVTTCLGSIVEPHYGIDLVTAGVVKGVQYIHHVGKVRTVILCKNTHSCRT